MEPQTITAFLAIGAAIILGFFGNAIFTKYRIPEVLILVAFGMLIGPDVLGTRFGLVTDRTLRDIAQFKDLFLSIALVIILFDGGLTLDIRTVIESARLSLLMSVLTFILEMLIIATLVQLISHVDFLICLILGGIVGGTTEAVVIPIASRMRIKEKTKAMLIMESVVTDVLVIVTVIALIKIAQLGETSATMFIRELAVKFLIGGAVGLLAGIGWLFVLQRLHNQPLSYMLSVGALFAVAGLVELPQIGSSSAVAALMFGLAIGNRQYIKRRLTSKTLTLPSDEYLQHFSTEITFFVRTFFFVYLGLMFDFQSFTAIQLVLGLLMISVIVMTRRVTSLISWKVGDLDRNDADAVFSMMPKGLSAAVLATLPAAMLAGSTIWEETPAKWNLDILFINVTLIVILGTTILATILSYMVEKKIDRTNREELRKRIYQNG
jgi:cell volume regulation protein A